MYHRASDELGHAPDGQWIAASEWAFRDALVQLMQESFQAGPQSKVDAHPTAQPAAHCVGATEPPRSASAPAPPRREPTLSAAAFSPPNPGLAKGWGIGSGPTEAMCNNLTLRLKRSGMTWDTDNAAALMNLVALREGGQWEQYWQTRKTA